MKRWTLLIGLGTLLLTSPALAQLDPDTDGVGIYFDPCACANCVDLPEGFHNAYLLITHPSSDVGVAAWELEISWTGPAMVTSYDLEGQALNAEVPPEFAVGLAEPLSNPYMWPAVVVMTMQIWVQSTDEAIDFFIDGIYFHSLPDQVPAYLDGGDLTTLIELRQSTGGPDFPVATINGDCAVAVENAAWGDVKSLYR